jgi:hypothetical protein
MPFQRDESLTSIMLDILGVSWSFEVSICLSREDSHLLIEESDPAGEWDRSTFGYI